MTPTDHCEDALTRTSTEEQWDAIVVGGGLGGLVARPTSPWPDGGCSCSNSTTGRAATAMCSDAVAPTSSMSAVDHYLGDCRMPTASSRPSWPVWAPVTGCRSANWTAILDQIVIPGLTLDVPADWDEYLARLESVLPDDVEALRTFTAICRAVGSEQRWAMLTDAELPEIVAGTADVQAWSRRRLSELFDHCGLSTRARTVLAAQSPNYGIRTGRRDGDRACDGDRPLSPTSSPVGGGQMLAATLIEVLEAHGGGKLRTRSRVASIDVADRVATGVRLTDGASLAAPLVISNADYRRTVLDLAGAGRLNPRIGRTTREATIGPAFATVYVALDRELTRRAEANIWWYDHEDIDELYGGLYAGEQPEDVRFLFVSVASLKNPGARHLCPPGRTNIQLMTMCPPGYRHWGVEQGPAEGGRYRREPAYLAEKQRFTDAVVRARGRACWGRSGQHHASGTGLPARPGALHALHRRHSVRPRHLGWNRRPAGHRHRRPGPVRRRPEHPLRQRGDRRDGQRDRLAAVWGGRYWPKPTAARCSAIPAGCPRTAPAGTRSRSPEVGRESRGRPGSTKPRRQVQVGARRGSSANSSMSRCARRR